MDRAGQWFLAPAFDVTYSYNPACALTSKHQMTLNGKGDGFTFDDLKACAKTAMMKNGRAKTILAEVTGAVEKWQAFAEEADVAQQWRGKIEAAHRKDIV